MSVILIFLYFRENLFHSLVKVGKFLKMKIVLVL